MSWSDDDIDTILDGDPDAYWIIDWTNVITAHSVAVDKDKDSDYVRIAIKKSLFRLFKLNPFGGFAFLLYIFFFTDFNRRKRRERGGNALANNVLEKVIMDEKRNLFQQINQRLSHYDLRRQLGIGQEQRRELIL